MISHPLFIFRRHGLVTVSARLLTSQREASTRGSSGTPERDHSNRMWCRAVYLWFCVCRRAFGAVALGVARLTHTCARAERREAALLTQPCAAESRGKSNTGMPFLSNATCVSVSVGFVPPQSLTHADYLCLRQKAHTSHIL